MRTTCLVNALNYLAEEAGELAAAAARINARGWSSLSQRKTLLKDVKNQYKYVLAVYREAKHHEGGIYL